VNAGSLTASLSAIFSGLAQIAGLIGAGDGLAGVHDPYPGARATRALRLTRARQFYDGPGSAMCFARATRAAGKLKAAIACASTGFCCVDADRQCQVIIGQSRAWPEPATGDGDLDPRSWRNRPFKTVSPCASGPATRTGARTMNRPIMRLSAGSAWFFARAGETALTC